MIHYKIKNEEYVHIQAFVDAIGRSQQSVRHLIEDGNSVRRLYALRERSRLLLPIKELVGYPFVNQGKQQNGKDIYHYVPYDKDGNVVDDIIEAWERTDTEDLQNNEIEWRRCFCESCTYTLEHCQRRREADDLSL